VDANGGGGPVHLVAVNTINVDDPLFAVDLGDLAFSPLELATDDQNFIIFANR
jgi:hypothetical protein